MNTPKSNKAPKQDAEKQESKNSEDKNNPDNAAVMVLGQSLKDLSLEVPNAPAVLPQEHRQPAVSVMVDVNGRKFSKDDPVYETTVDFKIQAKFDEGGDKEVICFILELSYSTILRLGDQVSKDRQDFIALVEGAVLGFPFARAIISNTVQDAGFPSIYLTPVNFVELIQAKANRAAQEKKNKS